MKHCKVHLLILSILLISITSLAQSNGAIAQKSGIIIGNVLSAENQKAIPAATVILYSLDNKNDSASTTTLKDGSFILEKLDFAYYKLQITAIGFASLKIDSIHLSEAVLDYLQRLVTHTRQSRDFAHGLSPRGLLSLKRATQAWAFIEGRSYAIPEDVQAVLPAVAEHRLRGSIEDQSRMHSLTSQLLNAVDVIE